MEIWISFLLLGLMTPLLGMRTTMVTPPPGPLLIQQQVLMVHGVSLRQIWTGTEIWIYYRLLLKMIPLHGMRTTMVTPLPGQPLIQQQMQTVLDLFLQQIWMGMGIWISFLLLGMMTLLHGMRITMVTPPLGPLLTQQQMQMVHIQYLRQIWMGMEIWILYRLLIMMTPSHGMRTTMATAPLGPLLIQQQMQMAHNLSMRQIWMGMGIWIQYRLLILTTPLHGMRTTMVTPPLGQLLIQQQVQMVHFLSLRQIWMGMEIRILYRLLLLTILLHGMRITELQILLGPLLIQQQVQIVHNLFMQQIWMGMVIWIQYRLLMMMTPLLGMRIVLLVR